MGLVLDKWVEEHIHSMDENEIIALVDVLDLVSTFPHLIASNFDAFGVLSNAF